MCTVEIFPQLPDQLFPPRSATPVTMFLIIQDCSFPFPPSFIILSSYTFLSNPLFFHRLVDRLDHVVEGQRGDGDGGERFHLDAGLRARADARLDVVAARASA